MMVITRKLDGISFYSSEIGAVCELTGLSEKEVRAAKVIGYDGLEWRIILAKKLYSNRGGDRRGDGQ